MNYYGPRELRDGHGNGLGQWHYTCHNRRIGTWPVGYCTEHDGHDSSTAARACYRQFLLDHKTHEVEYDTASPCLVCGIWTPKALQVDQGHQYFLCDDHRKIEEVAERFGIVGDIVSSY